MAFQFIYINKKRDTCENYYKLFLFILSNHFHLEHFESFEPYQFF